MNRLLNALLSLCIGFTTYGKFAPWTISPAIIVEFDQEYQGSAEELPDKLAVYNYTYLSLNWLRGRVYLRWLSSIEYEDRPDYSFTDFIARNPQPETSNP